MRPYPKIQRSDCGDVTEFTGVDVPIGGGRKLFIDGNSKITRDNGTFAAPAPNALSLPHVTSCPGATPTCAGSCFVHGLRRAVPGLWAKYQENLETLKEVSLLGERLWHESAFALTAWISEHCQGGFRWHVSGDLCSVDHAHWVAQVSRHANVPCWLYTRSFNLIPTYPPNLVINLSADRDNYHEALEVHKDTGLRICYLVDDSGHVPEDLPEGSVLFPDYAIRGRDLPDPMKVPWWRGLTHSQRRKVCPADFFGQAKSRRCGPCKKCLT